MNSNMCVERLEDTRICTNCRGKFNKLPEWRYYYKDKIACTYHCMRALERADPNSYLSRKESGRSFDDMPINSSFQRVISESECKRRAKKMRLPDDKIAQIRFLYSQGLTAYAVGKRMGLALSTIYKYIKDVKKDAESVAGYIETMHNSKSA